MPDPVIVYDCKDFLGLVTNADQADLAAGASPSLKNVSVERPGTLRTRRGLARVNTKATGRILSMTLSVFGHRRCLVWHSVDGDDAVIQHECDIDPAWTEPPDTTTTTATTTTPTTSTTTTTASTESTASTSSTSSSSTASTSTSSTSSTSSSSTYSTTSTTTTTDWNPEPACCPDCVCFLTGGAYGLIIYYPCHKYYLPTGIEDCDPADENCTYIQVAQGAVACPAGCLDWNEAGGNYDVYQLTDNPCNTTTTTTTMSTTPNPYPECCPGCICLDDNVGLVTYMNCQKYLPLEGLTSCGPADLYCTYAFDITMDAGDCGAAGCFTGYLSRSSGTVYKYTITDNPCYTTTSSTTTTTTMPPTACCPTCLCSLTDFGAALVRTCTVDYPVICDGTYCLYVRESETPVWTRPQCIIAGCTVIDDTGPAAAYYRYLLTSYDCVLRTTTTTTTWTPPPGEDNCEDCLCLMVELGQTILWPCSTPVPPYYVYCTFTKFGYVEGNQCGACPPYNDSDRSGWLYLNSGPCGPGAPGA